MATTHVDELRSTLQDAELQREFDADPGEALRHLDLWDAAAELSLELTELQRTLDGLIEKVRLDAGARHRLRVDPAGSLREAGLPEEAIEPLLAAMKRERRRLI